MRHPCRIEIDPPLGAPVGGSTIERRLTAAGAPAGPRRNDECASYGTPSNETAGIESTHRHRSRASRRVRPANCSPARSAVATANAVGALTATSARKPAAHALCTSSKLARPLTTTARPIAGPAGPAGVGPPPCRPHCDDRRLLGPARRLRRDPARRLRALRRSCRTVPASVAGPRDRRLTPPLDRVAFDRCEHRCQFIDVVGTAETARGRGRRQPRGRFRGTAAGRDRDDVEGGARPPNHSRSTSLRRPVGRQAALRCGRNRRRVRSRGPGFASLSRPSCRRVQSPTAPRWRVTGRRPATGRRRTRAGPALFRRDRELTPSGYA